MKKIPKRKYITTTDSEGALVLPKEIEAEIGDEYATWKEGENIMLVFLKNYRGKRRIPKDALGGKVEPALPGSTVDGVIDPEQKAASKKS